VCVCVYGCVRLCVCLCKRARVCVYVCMYLRTYVGRYYVCVWVYVCVYMHVCVRMYVCTYVRMYVWMYVFMYECKCVYIYIYIYISRRCQATHIIYRPTMKAHAFALLRCYATCTPCNIPEERRSQPRRGGKLKFRPIKGKLITKLCCLGRKRWWPNLGHIPQFPRGSLKKHKNAESVQWLYRPGKEPAIYGAETRIITD
jgi:nuclear pore complex protein Nup62